MPDWDAAPPQEIENYAPGPHCLKNCYFTFVNVNHSVHLTTTLLSYKSTSKLYFFSRDANVLIFYAIISIGIKTF